MRGLKRWLAGASAACLLGSSPLTLPQTRADDGVDLKAVLQRLDRLEKQNQQLEKQNQDLHQKIQEIELPVIQDKAGAVAPSGGPDYKKAVDEYLSEKDAKARAEAAYKKKEAEDKGFVVGENLGLTAKWLTTSGLAGPDSRWMVGTE